MIVLTPLLQQGSLSPARCYPKGSRDIGDKNLRTQAVCSVRVKYIPLLTLNINRLK